MITAVTLCAVAVLVIGPLCAKAYWRRADRRARPEAEVVAHLDDHRTKRR